ncbi:PmoA family protein [Pseudonocardia sp. CA-107938]|uniref:DUF6807 domain-containing protein n=1 Tax=Pseudonocardia sp. CA-107938 TaxID=3240021 RepID=UPI003D92EF5B
MTHPFRVGGVEVARYRVDSSDLDPTLGRRPYLHPIRTLGGTVVTDTFPADHRWHLGFSVAVPDVDGSNFWGGRSYRAADGYQPRGDHGTIAHTRWLDRADDRAEHELQWVAHNGDVLLHEYRLITATGGEAGWTLRTATRLRNATDRPIALGSPGSAGRVGAGYGGLFWRLPPGTPEVSGPELVGEEQLNGVVTPWLRVTGDGYALEFSASDGDPWFVRAAEYPGVGTAFAWDTPTVLEPGAELRRSLQVVVKDG